MVHCTRDLSRASSELHVIARDNCDCFIALPAPVVIGRSNCLVLVFRQSFENRSKLQNQYNNRVYVRGHKYVLGPTQTHFSPSR